MTATTTSFLMNCPQCGVMIPRDSVCTDCHWSEQGEAEGDTGQDFVQEFAARRQTHYRNYAIFVGLKFAAGFIGLITAVMWFMVIYRGSVVAFVLVGLFTVAAGLLGALTAYAKKLFPFDLHCPSCEIRLDELGTDGDHCPSCSALLQ